MAGLKPRREAFFLPGSAAGGRFCLLTHAVDPVGTLIFVHPFAEEMNKSRRMAALQARKWKHSDAVPRLAEDISSMVDSYFHWLSHESLHGPVFLRTTLALIGASRSGIAEVDRLCQRISSNAAANSSLMSYPLLKVAARNILSRSASGIGSPDW